VEIAAQWPRVLVRRLSKRWIVCLRRRAIAARGFGSAPSSLRQTIHPPPAMLLTMNSSSPFRMAAGSGSTWGSVALTGSLAQVSCGIVRQCSFEYCRPHLTFSRLREAEMEMHQVRYFLAVADELNFTRAAERCHVAQPSLTRAIKLLEEELGGPLLHRERANTHLSELGRMVKPSRSAARRRR